MAGGAAVNVMTFEEGWHIIEKEALGKFIHNLEVEPPCKKLLTPEEYMRFYTFTYNVAMSEDDLEKIKLYEKYKKTFEDYISSKVLPSLRCYENETLLKEFLRRWNNHKIMIKWLSNFFPHLLTQQQELPLPLESIHLAFYGRAYAEIKGQISGAIATLGYREIGDRVHEAFVPLNNESCRGAIRAIFKECRSDALRIFGKDIEEALIEATTRFYSNKALEWMATMSYEDYTRKVEECLEKEKGRVSKYLRITKEEEILKIVQHELLNVHADELEAMKITSKIKTL